MSATAHSFKGEVRRPRVALCGSAGVGKTTLAQALARRWGVTYVEEGMRRRLQKGLDPHDLTRDQHRALLQELAEESHSQATAAIQADGGVVCDRSPMDALAFWLHYGFVYDPPAETEVLVRREVERCSLFDLILVLPWGALPLADDGVRAANPWLQLQFQCLVEGLARELLPEERLATLPKSITSQEARVAWTEERLGALAALPSG